jgi:nicotinamide-nucleotide amidase
MKSPRICLLAVGDEILHGRVADTNSSFLAHQLLEKGLPVSHFRSISDAPGELLKQLEGLTPEFDLIISSGGLGPTMDDRVGIEIRDSDFKKEELNNPAGSANGYFVELPSNTSYLALPGPPIECRATFLENGLSKIEHIFKGSRNSFYATLHFVGIKEVDLVNLASLEAWNAVPGTKIGITASENGATLSISAHDTNEAVKNGSDVVDSNEEGVQNASSDAEYRVHQFEKAVSDNWRNLIQKYDLSNYPLGFGIDKAWFWGRGNVTLPSEVIKLALEGGFKLASAESCTGGQLAAALIDIPGASQVFSHGWVTYSNQAKCDQLGVSIETIQDFGAVSEEVAKEMALGAKKRSGADFAVSISGVAGPGGGTKEKPVGMVCLAIAYPGGVQSVTTQQYALGGRSRIQKQSVRDALVLFLRTLIYSSEKI